MTKIIKFPDKDANTFPTYVDANGDKWYPHACEYILDGEAYAVEIWAKSIEHAKRALKAVSSGEVLGRKSEELLF